MTKVARPLLLTLAVSLCLFASACGESSTVTAGGISPDEADALNAAAAKIDNAATPR